MVDGLAQLLINGISNKPIKQSRIVMFYSPLLLLYVNDLWLWSPRPSFRMVSWSLLPCLFKDSLIVIMFIIALFFFSADQSISMKKILAEHTSPSTYCFISACFYDNISWKKIWYFHFFTLYHHSANPN